MNELCNDELDKQAITPKSTGAFGRSESFSSQQDQEKENMQVEEDLNKEEMRPSKREREDTDTEDSWTHLRKEKKEKIAKTEIQVYISHKEKLPKQFALAKIFREYKIENILRVKYLNPYRVRVDFENEESLETLRSCEYFKQGGFKLQDSMTVNLSYGIIRAVDLELSEEQIVKEISCPSPAKLISAQRLNRRDKDENHGWIPSESVRLCFEGSYLPPYVSVLNMKINVERYVFPVTQCARCWRFGHSTKRCPSQKVVCPKCSGNHTNCETKEFKCANCSGNHISLDKICPEFSKQKRIREIMADFNCTYRKALKAYVPKQEDGEETSSTNIIPTKYIPAEENIQTLPIYKTPTSSITPSYAQVIKTKAIIENPPRTQTENTSTKKKKRKTKNVNPRPLDCEPEWKPEYKSDEEESPIPSSEEEQQDRGVTFRELLSRLRDIIFLKNLSWESKIKQSVKACVEWLILMAVENMSDWPMLKGLFEYITDQSGSKKRK